MNTNKNAVLIIFIGLLLFFNGIAKASDTYHLPYDSPRTARKNVFEFTQKPVCLYVGDDKYAITFTVKDYCDVTIGIIDKEGKVVRHLASGVLGKNAPAPFQKNSKKQKVIWDGKDDLSAYPRNPFKLRVRVMVGLKPTFDKNVIGISPYHTMGRTIGVAIDEQAAYILSYPQHGEKLYIRKFDHQGNYLQSLVPPSTKTPRASLNGMGFVEYAPGKRALHASNIYDSISAGLRYPVGDLGRNLADLQPALIGNKLYFCTSGEKIASRLFYIHTDGTTDAVGIKGRPLNPRVFSAGKNRGMPHSQARFASSPDGKWIYMTTNKLERVWRFSPEDTKPAHLFLGDRVGSDNQHFAGAAGIACDPSGRIYVCDTRNNRIQVYASDKKYLKTIKITKPIQVCVHPKTGAIYVQHQGRNSGKTTNLLTKLASFEHPKPVAHAVGPYGIMALDSWSKNPRVWFTGSFASGSGYRLTITGSSNVSIWEEQGKTFKQILTFNDKIKKNEKKNKYIRPAAESRGAKIVCNPGQEIIHYAGSQIIDLKSGKHLASFSYSSFGARKDVELRGSFDDIAIDKRGYMHIHFNPGFYMPGVGRVQTARQKTEKGTRVTYPEVPYDYGIAKRNWAGILPTWCQPGAKFFQDGIGVNMRGDIAVQSNIYYVPKMDSYANSAMNDQRTRSSARGDRVKLSTYSVYKKNIMERAKRGEKTYSMKRISGVPLSGGTIWTFDHSGELDRECAMTAGDLMNGALIDLDGSVYTVNARPKLVDGKIFLSGLGGIIGQPRNKNSYLFTGTLIKAKAKGICNIILSNAPLPLDDLPKTPPVLQDTNHPFILKPNMKPSGVAWIEGVEWLYAGASPIVSHGCSCPTQRAHLDWYKRVYVPEQYRHSIGILDTAGNLIMHLGQFGNYDDVRALKRGETEIPMQAVRFISGTDNYLCFEDAGERLLVLKLDYHIDETIPIKK